MNTSQSLQTFLPKEEFRKAAVVVVKSGRCYMLMHYGSHWLLSGIFLLSSLCFRAGLPCARSFITVQS